MSDIEATGPAPGALSALIARVAHAPPVDVGQAWAIPLRPGARVGRYEIKRELGRGGFGAVYEALDHDLGRLVAVKTVRPGRVLAAEGGAAWLRDEAEAIASLSHPGIVSVYDVGEAEGAPFVVMELLRGETLQERLARRSPLGLDEALSVARDVAAALAYAHARGVVHRDLTPGNVFLCDDGRTKLLDFGLAHVFGHEARRSGGTPAYLAPERWKGEPEDARTDVFSLGVLLHETLCGKVPYPANDAYSAALDPGPPPPLAVPGVPRRLAALVARSLSKDPAGRPASAGKVLEELALVQRAVEARRHRWLRIARNAALAAAVVALGAEAWIRIGAPAGPPLPVTVADFTNETGDPTLDGLSGLLITSLEQSRRLQVLTRSRMVDVLRQLGRDEAGPIDEQRAREIGRQAGAHAVLLGSVRRFDQTYSVAVRALDPVANADLFAVSEKGEGKAAIPEIVDRLSAGVRGRLRETGAEIRSSAVEVAKVVTPNLEAHRHYFVGVDCLYRPSGYPDHPRGCLRELHEAVKLDPGFALAWLQIALAGWDELTPATEDRRFAIAQALRNADRVPPKERTLMRAWAAHLDGKDDEALSILGDLIAQYPDDKQALFIAGDLSWHRDDQAAVVPYMSRVLKLDPTNEYALDHLSYALAVLGRRDELEPWVRAWSGMAPTLPVLRALVQGELGLGDGAAAVAAARRALAQGGDAFALRDVARSLAFTGDYATLEREMARREQATPVLRYYLAHALAAQGRRAEALRVLAAVERGAANDEVRRDVHLVRALVIADGDPAAVWAEAQAVLKTDAPKAPPLAVYLARLGDIPHARELAARAEPGSAYHDLFEAVAEWKAGHGAQARARLDGLEARYPLPRGVVAPAFLRAEVAAGEGLDAEAVDALRRFQRLPFQSWWRSWAHPRSLVLLARSLDRLGKRDEARAELDRFFRLWAHADPGLPLLAEARELRTRLGPPSTGGEPGAH